jgi:competence protein ComFC
MSIKINPRKIKGNWQEGYALDLHTTGSTFLGHDAFGNPQFDTSRTPLGDLLYQLKYRFDPAAVELIVATVVEFLQQWKPKVDIIIPVPASNTARKQQPVIALAKAISERTGIDLRDGSVAKVKQTQQLKNVFDYKQRISALENAFAIEKKETSGKRILLFDDLYRSGATLNAIAEKLTKEGEAKAVFVLTLTRTRSKL